MVLVGHDVDAIDDHPRGLRRAQDRVQHGPLLRHLDLLTAEHCGDALAQAAYLGEAHEQRYGVVGNAVLRVFKIETAGFGGQALATPGMSDEERPQMQATDGMVMKLLCRVHVVVCSPMTSLAALNDEGHATPTRSPIRATDTSAGG